MGKKQTEIQLKKANEAIKLAALQRALDKAKKANRATNQGGQKRKDAWFLSQFVAVPLGGNNAVRQRADFAAKSYNLGRQVIGLIDHMFVKYPVPTFLYRSVLSRSGIQLALGPNQRDPDFWRDSGTPQFVRWFLIAAQGGSLAKELKDVLTKKEVHCFLQAPWENTIVRNLFWAKCFAAGIPAKTCQFLTDQIGGKNQQKEMGDRIDDVVRFYANEHARMRGNDLQQITDFVRAVIAEPAFSFKGRTLGSMVKLSEEWHQAVFSVKVTEFKSWIPMFGGWEHKSKGQLIRAVELTNSRALADEGRRQKHCVWSYVNSCANGHARIVSIRWLVDSHDPLNPGPELSRLTLEVRMQQRAVVQIRGKVNREAEDHEMRIVRLWAGEHGLTIDEWC
jgi:hypothetical protein